MQPVDCLLCGSALEDLLSIIPDLLCSLASWIYLLLFTLDSLEMLLMESFNFRKFCNLFSHRYLYILEASDIYYSKGAQV